MCTCFKILRDGLCRNLDNIAIVETDNKTEVTYGQLLGHISYCQDLLQTNGLIKGDKVSIVGSNSLEWIVSYLSVTLLGGIVVPLSPLLSRETQSDLILFSDVSLVIGEYSINRGEAKYIPMKDVLDPKERICTSLIFNESVSEEDLQSIIYTSGTSSSPKGVMLPYRSISHNLLHAQSNMPLHVYDVICSFMPFHHSLGCMYNFLYPIAQTAKNIIVKEKLSVASILQTCEQYHPSIIYTTPLIIEKIFQLVNSRVNGSLSLLNSTLCELLGGQLRELIVGGASLNVETEKKLLQAGFPIVVGYGMTECGPIVSYTTQENYKFRSSGRVAKHLETYITDEKELLLKGESLFLGYFKDIELTDRVFRDGWFCTGDRVEIEGEERTLYNIGRLKNMILGSNGQNIYPEEIEYLFNQLSYVESSVVIKRGNTLVALLHIIDSSLDNEYNERLLEDLKKINAQLPLYAQIKKIEIYTTDFERTQKNEIKRYLYQ